MVIITLSVYFFKDQLVNEFIRKANNSLNTPVKIGKTDVSVWADFPNLSIVFYDVYVEDSHEGQYPLLTASSIAFQLHAGQLLKGIYEVKGLKIAESETNLKIDSKGQNNFVILKENQAGDTSSIRFELKNVVLTDANIHYTDRKSRQEHHFFSGKLTTSIQTQQSLYAIEASGSLTTKKIQVRDLILLRDKEFELATAILYDDKTNHLTITPSEISINKSAFDLHGTYSWKDKNLIDLVCKGKKSDLQTLISLLPTQLTKPIEKYKSKGDVYFSCELKGEISNNKSPSINASFGFSNATIFHPDFNTQIENANLSGSFASQSLSEFSEAVLVLKDVTASLNQLPFRADLVIQNFTDPEVILNFSGQLDVNSLLSFYPIKNISSASGQLSADIAFEGKLSLLKRKATAQQTSTRGSIEMDSISLTYDQPQIQLQNLTGSLQFNNNDLALSNVTGVIGQSDFQLNGFFKNIITFLLFENQPIGIETDLHARHLDVSELFALGFAEQQSTEQYSFAISKNLYLNFNCDVKSLRYKKFNAHEVKGDLLVKNQVAVSRNLSFNALGGALSLTGIVDAQKSDSIDVISSFKLQQVHVDSIFYVFENFQQQFIEDRHLKGQATADVTLEATLKPDLSLYPQTLTADISALIKKGELNNFEPMKKLNKYLDDESLSQLRFADLKNDIHIENKTIYIPQMEVRSNATVLQISGTHTFDQRIDYRVVTPLRNKQVINLEEAKGAVEEMEGRSKLFLKITGTTDDYRVQYDTEAVKKKIISDLKKEVLELKNTFRTKGKQKEKAKELEEDDYFDWENPN
jgi:hypothetical protein